MVDLWKPYGKFHQCWKRDLGKIKKHSAQKVQSLNINQSGKKASTNLSPAVVLSFNILLLSFSEIRALKDGAMHIKLMCLLQQKFSFPNCHPTLLSHDRVLELKTVVMSKKEIHSMEESVSIVGSVNQHLKVSEISKSLTSVYSCWMKAIRHLLVVLEKSQYNLGYWDWGCSKKWGQNDFR